MQIKKLNIITSPYEFMKMWQSLKGDTDLSAHAELLLAVPPSDLLSGACLFVCVGYSELVST